MRRPKDVPEPPVCGAKTRAGTPCKCKALCGATRCWKHGAGSRIRVLRGERKPAGRPPIHGGYADPERMRYNRLQELIDKAKASPADLRSAEAELALLKGVLAWQYEKLLNGTWDVQKTPDLQEHPASWLIESGAKVIDKVARVNGMINRDRIQGMVALVDPVINVVLTIIEQHVPDDAKALARESVRERLSQILVPTG